MQSTKPSFYQQTWFMWAALFAFAPLGLFLMWKYSNFGKIAKIALSVVFAILFIAIYAPKSPTETVPSAPALDVDKSISAAQTLTSQVTQPAAAPPESKPEPAVASAPAVRIYKEGMYKIGADMDAGEYLLTTSSSGYYEVTSDSSGAFSSIISNDNFAGTRYITVVEGQYLSLTRCNGIQVNDIEPADLSTGKLGEGMYKIGFDLPAGEYKVNSPADGYMEVTSDSRGGFESIVTNDNFTGDKYITVSDGQYLKLVRCSLVV